MDNLRLDRRGVTPGPRLLAGYVPLHAFPATRGELIGHACRARAPQDLITALRSLPRNEHPYAGPAEVLAALETTTPQTTALETTALETTALQTTAVPT